MTKSTNELRNSAYHQQFGRKLCAAFIAQQQGIALESAFRKVPDPIADTWLVVAEFAREVAMQGIDQNIADAIRDKTHMLI